MICPAHLARLTLCPGPHSAPVTWSFCSSKIPNPSSSESLAILWPEALSPSLCSVLPPGTTHLSTSSLCNMCHYLKFSGLRIVYFYPSTRCTQRHKGVEFVTRRQSPTLAPCMAQSRLHRGGDRWPSHRPWGHTTRDRTAERMFCFLEAWTLEPVTHGH